MSRITGIAQFPLKPDSPMSVTPINRLAESAVLEVTVQTGTPLTMLRNGNKVVIGWRGGVSGGGGAFPIPQKVGMVVGAIAPNTLGGFYPFAIESA